MSEELIKKVQKLIDYEIGESKRLDEIFGILKQGSPLYLSDYKYLESLIDQIEEYEKTMERNEKERRPVKKSQKKSGKTSKSEKVQSKEDNALRILKNRLASGEITIDEFNNLKKVIKET